MPIELGRLSLMQFELDKHDKQRVYWLMRDIYECLKTDEYINQMGKFGHECPWDWGIDYKDLPGGNEAYGEQSSLNIHRKSMKRGDILQPIVIINNSNVIDGRHKLAVYRELSFKTAAQAYPIRDGTGEVIFDNVYRPLIGDLVDIGKRPEDILCLNCGKKMIKKDLDFHCKCSRVVRSGLLGWSVPNLENK